MADSDDIRAQQRAEIERRNRKANKKDPFKVSAEQQKRARERRERDEGSTRRDNKTRTTHIPGPDGTRKEIMKRLTDTDNK